MRTRLRETDLDAALEYYARLSGDNQYNSLGYTIAVEYAKKSPEEALAWARENDTSDWGQLTTQVLSQIAATDPEFAMTEALKTRNSNQTAEPAAEHHESRRATRPRPRDTNAGSHREPGGQTAGGGRSHQHLGAEGTRCGGQLGTGTGQAHIRRTHGAISGQMLPRMDLDAALQIMPRIEGEQGQQMRIAIAQRLAQTRSVADAQAFVRQYQWRGRVSSSCKTPSSTA